MVGAGRRDPIPVARAKGIYFWTPEGKRFLDFNSQLMCVNIGHGDERVIRAIQEQAATLAYANPFMATEARARLGVKLAISPGDIDASSSPTAAPKPTKCDQAGARGDRAPQDPARFRSYHGATAGSMLPTGDPRRWASEPGLPASSTRAIRSRHPARQGYGRGARDARGGDPVRRSEDFAAFIIETVTGTNGILVPPDGYLQGVRSSATARHP